MAPATPQVQRDSGSPGAMELPYDVLQLVLSKVEQPAGITRRVCREWRQAADSLVTAAQPRTPQALQLLPSLCPSITALDLSAFCTPSSQLQSLSSLQYLQELSVRCWPSESAACLQYLQAITALSSLSLSSPCQAAECQLAFHDWPDDMPFDSSQAGVPQSSILSTTSSIQNAGPHHTCSIDPPAVSAVHVLMGMPALQKLQVDKHTFSLLLHTHIPAWLSEGLEGCSSITLNMSGIAKLAQDLEAESTSRELSEQHLETFAKAILASERLLAISCSTIQQLQPDTGQSFESRLQQALVKYDNPVDRSGPHLLATNLTELHIIGQAMTSKIMLVASALPLLRVLSLSVSSVNFDDLAMLQTLKQLSNLCLDTSPMGHDGQTAYTNLSTLLQGFHRLGRLGIIMAIIPRDFALQVTASAEEVFLSTDIHTWASSSGFLRQKPWQGPFLPDAKCARLDLPWPPNPHEVLDGRSLADTAQLRQLAFPLIPPSTQGRQRRLVDWHAPCMSTLASLRLDVRPVDGLQDCWEQGVAGLTALTSLSIIGGKPIEMHGRFHMKAMGHGGLKPISQLTRLRQLTIDVIQPLAERELDALHPLTALTSLFIGDLVQISDLCLGLLMPLRDLSSVHLRHMNPLPHTERPVVSVEALARFAVGHPLACKLCLGEVASCQWHQTPVSRRFEPDVGLLLDFQSLSVLAALCPNGILACKDDLAGAAAELRSIGSPLCKSLKIKETCSGSKALAAFQLPSSRHFVLHNEGLWNKMPGA